MARDSQPAADAVGTDAEERAPNTWLNALAGAAVSVFLAFIPFSPVLGGVVAGYLEGGDTVSGATVGAISGFFAAIPITLVGLAIAAFVIVGVAGRAPLFVAVIVLILGGLYTIGLGAIGGILGVYLKTEI